MESIKVGHFPTNSCRRTLSLERLCISHEGRTRMSIGTARKHREAAIDTPSSLGADAFNDNFGRPVMTDFGAQTIRDEVILIARILLALLFLTFGWGKLTNFSGT